MEDNNGKFLHAPKALFAVPVDTSQRLRTVAIQQYQTPSTQHPLVGAPDPSIRDSWDEQSDGSKTFGSSLSEADQQTLIKWAMAKTSVQSAESSYFEVVTHFGRTHLVMEPFMIATNVAFHETHPIRKLLQPHFEGTLHINQGAVDALISEGGVIDKIFPPPISVTQSIAVSACKDFLENYNDNMFDVAFEKRGTTTLPAEYPFRDDGMLLWNAIKDDVVKFTNEKIPEWNEEQPEWWTDQKKAMIPDCVIWDSVTLASIRTKAVEKIQQRRRSSLGLVALPPQKDKDDEIEGAIRRGSILN